MLLIKKLNILFFTLLFLFNVNAFATDYSSPLGYWNIIDSTTKKPSTLIYIYNDVDGTLAGKVLKLYAFSEKEPEGICTLCKGYLKNESMLNMNIIWGLRPIKKMIWGQGYILDPDSGKIYSLEVTLSEDGRSLNLRGYIFKPAFGETQQWKRAS